jgi:hypothetical protein
MTALSDTFCEENPLSCGIIQVHTQSHVNHRMLSILTVARFCTQRTLERAPGLVFVPGVGFRHRFDMAPPAPPPPPSPVQNIRYGPVPPAPSPPPSSPPPYYIGAEPCVPLPTAEFYGIDTQRENADASYTETRASCVFVKRITEKRIKASSCYAGISKR